MPDHVPRLCPLCDGPLKATHRRRHWPYGTWNRCTHCQTPEGYRTARGQVAALRTTFKRMVAEGRLLFDKLDVGPQRTGHLRGAANRR